MTTHLTLRRSLSRPGRSLVLGLWIALFALVGATTGAGAFWTLSVSSGNGAAVADQLGTPSTPMAAAVAGPKIWVTFTEATTTVSGNTIGSYTLTRYPASGGSGVVVTCQSQTIAGSTVNCYDTPPAGTWKYTDTPTDDSWTGAESSKSSSAVMPATPTLSDTTVDIGEGLTSPVTPTATLSGTSVSPAPTGTIDYSIYGPSVSPPSTCLGSGGGGNWQTYAGTSTVTASGAQAATSTFTPAAYGTYWMYDTYSGDTYDTATATSCTVSSFVVEPSLLLTQAVSVTNSCGLVLLGGSCNAQQSMTSASSATSYLIVAYFNSTTDITLSPPSATLTGPFGSVTAVSPNEFDPGLVGTGEVFAWTAEGNSTTSTAKVSVSSPILSAGDNADLWVFKVTNDTAGSPLAQSPANGAGASSTASAFFASTPAGGDGAVVVTATSGSAAPSTAPTQCSSAGTPSSYVTLYDCDPAATTQTFGYSSAQNWGVMALEFAHS